MIYVPVTEEDLKVNYEEEGFKRVLSTSAKIGSENFNVHKAFTRVLREAYALKYEQD